MALVYYIDPGAGITVTAVGGGILAMLGGFFGFLLLFFKNIFKFFKSNKRIVIILLSLMILAGIYLTARKYMKKPKSQFQNKVIILGFDALSPQIIEPLMAEGKLPNFAKLKQAGTYTHLNTTNPPQSPVAWTGFATGKNPGKNGIYDFITRNPDDYSLSLSLSEIKDTEPQPVKKTASFWNYTSDKGINNIIINAPVTFPPDKIKGKMLSGMGVPDILGTEGTFSFYTTKPKQKNKVTGGKVFYLQKTSQIKANLLGPRVARVGHKSAENSKIPFTISLNQGHVDIKLQNNRFSLAPKQWSDWQEVAFKLGPFKKAKGILRFYLVSTNPRVQLYASPINLDPRDPFFPISYPKNYSRQLTDKIGLFHTQGMPMDTWAVNEKRLDEIAFLEQVNQIDKERQDILNLELKQFTNGILFAYFESPDIIQHMFWRYTDPQHPLYEPDAPKKYKTKIQDWYVKMDQILGRVLKQASDQDLLIVLSDHGMDSFRRSVHLNSWLRTNGYLILRDSNQSSGKELLEDINWQKTKAYSIGFGAIYLNQKGREGKGIVKPGKETQTLKQEISQKLLKWQDTNGQPVVNKVYKSEDIFWGDYVHEAPDLYLGFNSGYRASWQTVLGTVPGKLIEDNLKKWSGTHLIDPQLVSGVLFTNKKIVKQSPSILDIAPTILDFTGFSKQEIKQIDFDGQSLL